jgi:centrosomal protein CEP89
MELCFPQMRSKDEQIEKLLDKISTLFNYNAQFAHENEKLQKEKMILAENFHAINQRLSEIQIKGCEKCANVDKAQATVKQKHDDLQTEAQELRDDVKMMKVLVFRLNLQLEYYQDVIRENRKLHPAQIQHQIDAASTSTPILSPSQTIHWGEVKSHVLAPLLNAYEETVNEKNDLIRTYHGEINSFTSRIKQLVAENEHLHREVDEIRASKETWINEQVRLQAQRNKAEVQTKRADLGKEKVIELIRCYEQKIQAMALDNERLQEAYSRSKSELATLRTIHQNPELMVDSLKECQKLFENLKLTYNDDKAKMLNEIKELKQKVDEQTATVHILEAKSLEQASILQRQKDCNDILLEKNTFLKQNMHRLRKSRDFLKSKLKQVARNEMQTGQDKMKHTYEDLKSIGDLIRRKEEQVRNMQCHHYAEVDTLNHKLRLRDDTVRKVLQNQTGASVRRKN